MGKFASVMFRLLLHTYSTEYAQHNGGGNSGTSTSSSGGNGSSAGNSGGVNSSAVCYEVRLVVSLSCALLQSLGESAIFCLPYVITLLCVVACCTSARED